MSKSFVWDGQFSPTIGMEIGLRYKNVDQGPCIVLYLSDEVGVFHNLTFGHEQCGQRVHYELYSIKSSETEE